jgi:single-stranded DNA-binding protein
LVKAFDDTNGDVICDLEKGETVIFSGRLKTESRLGSDGQPERQYYLTLSEK